MNKISCRSLLRKNRVNHLTPSTRYELSVNYVAYCAKFLARSLGNRIFLAFNYYWTAPVASSFQLDLFTLIYEQYAADRSMFCISFGRIR